MISVPTEKGELTMNNHEATEIAYKNGYEAGKPKWIPVTERLPESGVHVLVICEMYGQYLHGHYVCDGFRVDRYTQKVENTDYDIACEYCEEDDEYYLWEGWYEVVKNWDDFNSIVIGDTVTHWMPLPEPPKED